MNKAKYISIIKENNKYVYQNLPDFISGITACACCDNEISFADIVEIVKTADCIQENTYCDRFTDCKQCPQNRTIVLPNTHNYKQICLLDVEGVQDYQAYIEGLEKRVKEEKIHKYWLDINDSIKTWTLYKIIKDEDGDTYDKAVACGLCNQIPGYNPESEGDWEPFDDYFESKLGIKPEEWVVG